jgi:hypothetical protein
MTDVSSMAAAFAKARGSFSLHFDAAQNYVRPDDAPWTLILDGDGDGEGALGWGGFTAEEAIEFASAELAEEGAPQHD